MFSQVMQFLALSGVVVAFAGFTLFAGTYAYQANWRSTPAGRIIMYTVSSIDLVLLLTLVSFVFGPYPGYEFVAVAAFGLLAFVAWRLAYVLYRAQNLDPFHWIRWTWRTVKGWFTRKSS